MIEKLKELDNKCLEAKEKTDDRKIKHDINNLLTCVRGAIMLIELGDYEEAKEVMVGIEERIMEIINKI